MIILIVVVILCIVGLLLVGMGLGILIVTDRMKRIVEDSIPELKEKL